MTQPLLSPTRDNDVVLLTDVLARLQQAGALYGVTHARRDLLQLMFQTMLESMQGGYEDTFAATLTSLQTGRPSQPASERRGDPDVSHPSAILSRRAGAD